MAGPLTGYRVLDFGRFEVTPLAGVWLADMGADVIKVEARSGDPIRGSHPGSIAIVTAHNRGKRSIAIDVTRPEGREVALRLVARADVMMHNFRYGVMERLGLGYEDAARVNPGIVYAAASAFGPQGPRKADPGNDTLGQAAGGLAFATGVPDGTPIPAGAAIADAATGMALVAAVAAALLERTRSGEGQKIDLSLYGTLIGLQSWEVNFSSITGQLPRRNGGYPFLSGYGIYPTADSFLAIGGLNDMQWPRFCGLVGREELIERWKTSALRLENSRELAETVAAITRQKPTAHWLAALATIDVYACEVQSYQDILADEHACANGYITELEHPLIGSFKGAGSPFSFSRTTLEPGRAAPELAAHTEEILLEHGLEWCEVESLRDQGVIGFE